MTKSNYYPHAHAACGAVLRLLRVRAGSAVDTLFKNKNKKPGSNEIKQGYYFELYCTQTLFLVWLGLAACCCYLAGGASGACT
jgi:hypothetical protein